jgi:hypothetical protein
VTDRLNGFYVVLERDIRTDDVEPLLDAVRCLRGVLSVRPNVANWESQVAEDRAKRELVTKIYEVLK